MNRTRIITVVILSFLVLNFSIYALIQKKINGEIAATREAIDDKISLEEGISQSPDFLVAKLKTFFVPENAGLPDLFSSLEQAIRENHLVLGGYRISTEKGHREVSLSVEGEIDNLMRIMKQLRFSSNPIRFDNIGMTRFGRGFKMTGHAVFNQLPDFDNMDNEDFPETLDLQEIDRRISLYENVNIHQSYQEIFSFHSWQQDPDEQEKDAPGHGYPQSPKWLILLGKQRDRGKSCDSYYVLDNRTGRVRQLIPDVPLENWTLSKKNNIWVIQIDKNFYALEN